MEVRVTEEVKVDLCEDCKKKEGTLHFCPYQLEINDKEVEVCLCDDCYHERCMDI